MIIKASYAGLIDEAYKCVYMDTTEILRSILKYMLPFDTLRCCDPPKMTMEIHVSRFEEILADFDNKDDRVGDESHSASNYLIENGDKMEDKNMGEKFEDILDDTADSLKFEVSNY